MTVRPNTLAVRRYRATPEGRARTRLAAQVRAEAMRRLRIAHARHYKALLAEVWAEREHELKEMA